MGFRIDKDLYKRAYLLYGMTFTFKQFIDIVGKGNAICSMIHDDKVIKMNYREVYSGKHFRNILLEITEEGLEKIFND